MGERRKIKPKAYAPTDKGRRILELVCEYGGLTRVQLSILISPSFAYDNVHKDRIDVDTHTRDLVIELCNEGYLQARDRSRGANKKPSLNKLTAKGERYLASYSGKKHECATVPKDQSLDHFIYINDFRVALARATRDLGERAELIEAHDESILHTTHRAYTMTVQHPASPTWPRGKIEENITVVPDYYFHLVVSGEPRPSHFRRFLEFDRGTEVVKSSKDYVDWTHKITRYLEYTAVGGPCEKLYGTNSVIILTVTTSEKRLEHLKQASEKVRARTRFWFTVQSQLNAKTFFTDKIWQIAGKKGLCGFFDNPRELEDVAA